MLTVRTLQYLVLANAFLLAVQSVRIIALYSSIYSLTTGPRRQLPLHIWTIATSYLIYVTGSSYMLLFYGEDFALGRAIIFGVAGLMGQYALWNVLQYERRRYSSLTSFRDEQEPDQS